MPATSAAQQHTAQMALGVKRGRLRLSEVPEGARDAVKSMLSMSETQLRDFATTRTRQRATRGHRRGTMLTGETLD